MFGDCVPGTSRSTLLTKLASWPGWAVLLSSSFASGKPGGVWPDGSDAQSDPTIRGGRVSSLPTEFRLFFIPRMWRPGLIPYRTDLGGFQVNVSLRRRLLASR
jgi:hypothetical protein